MGASPARPLCFIGVVIRRPFGAMYRKLEIGPRFPVRKEPRGSERGYFFGDGSGNELIDANSVLFAHFARPHPSVTAGASRGQVIF